MCDAIEEEECSLQRCHLAQGQVSVPHFDSLIVLPPYLSMLPGRFGGEPFLSIAASDRVQFWSNQGSTKEKVSLGMTKRGGVARENLRR